MREIDLIELPQEVRDKLGDLSVLPPPVINLACCKNSEAVMRASVQLSMQAQRIGTNNPQAGSAMQKVALAGAVMGYIEGNFAEVKAVDTYEGKAREYMAEVSSTVAGFDTAFQHDLAEDQKTALRVKEYAAGLLQTTYSGALNRQVMTIAAAVHKAYINYLVDLSARYSTTPV